MEAYNLRQVLLAFRKEYLANKNQLLALKEYIQVIGKNIKDYNFFQYQEEMNKYIEMELERNESVIKKLYGYVKNRTTKDHKKQIQISHELDGEKRFLVLPESDTYKINDSKLNHFYYDVDAILGSQFTQGIKTPELLSNDSLITMRFDEGGITFVAKNGREYPATSIIYDGHLDRVLITPHHETIYPDQVSCLFNAPFNETSFPEYHRSILESSTELNKDFNIKGLSDTISTQMYKVVDSNEQVLLKRI